MWRKTLAPNHGMLFVYQHPRRLSFWMRNCLIDLSIAFLDRENTITEIRELKAYPEYKKLSDIYFFWRRRVCSSKPSQYALEMEADWFADNDVKIGDKLVWRLYSPDAWILRQNH